MMRLCVGCRGGAIPMHRESQPHLAVKKSRARSSSLRYGAALLVLAWGASAAGLGEETIVLYNTKVAASKEVALHYAERRQIPKEQLLGLPLPESEIMSRKEFREQLQEPLLELLEKRAWWVFTNRPEGQSAVKNAKIRYLVLCYGVPVRVQKDAALMESTELRPELRRNEAAVDSELALLPRERGKHALVGPVINPVYGQTNRAVLHPTNGVFIVGRLDGPTPAIARGLVDKAIEAETDGLWGRAYFDARGLTNSNYKLGDDWIRSAALISKRLGFETQLDDRAETFSAGFPLSHIAFYAGWYEPSVCGPFARGQVEFMPGAFAYHLHSFSAAVLRTATSHWAGPLLAKGAAATIGYVDEPYLEFTANISLFLACFTMAAFTYGEAALVSQPVLSWQTTVLGDPLYCPYAKQAPELHEELARRQSPMLQWSFLRAINQNVIMGDPAQKFTGMLERENIATNSAVLTEKLGDIHFSSADFEEAIEAYRRALKLQPSDHQRVRLMLAQARTLALFQQKAEALQLYEEFIQKYPDYPDQTQIYARMLPLAQALGKTAEAEKYQKLTHPPATNGTKNSP